ncbi:unnamed protein product [Gemmata massiliana]|uniref:Uncharacterized protein n=1 Tax=Gemmata massiliana TaxID=1210884 RepID=A0A6P2CXQ3_9BACT|nr:unnamed protein product [Gemmata massiliana]
MIVVSFHEQFDTGPGADGNATELVSPPLTCTKTKRSPAKCSRSVSRTDAGDLSQSRWSGILTSVPRLKFPTQGTNRGGRCNPA